MKRRIWVPAVVAVLALSISGTALAAARHNTNVTLAKSQTVNDDYFAAGNTVSVAGTVNGDVYVAGGQVTIDGTVNGDVLASGGTINISGTVNGNVRAGGGTVTVSGVITHNATLGGGTIDLTKTSEIGGNIVAGGGTINLAGTSKGNARLGSGTINITGSNSGNVMAGVGQLTVGSDAKIGGYLKYWSDQVATISPDAKITGAVTQIQPPQRNQSVARRIGLSQRLFWFGSVLLTGLVLLLVVPDFTREVVATIEKRFWVSVGIGLVGLIVTPIAAILVMVTVIGIPLGLALLVLYGFSIALATVWAALVTGDVVARAFKITNHAYVVLLVGALAYGILLLIPIVNAFAGTFGLLAGLGGSWLAVQRTYVRLRQAKQI